MTNQSFGVWAVDADGAGWLHCPIFGTQIRGSRSRMRQYAQDMTALTYWIRPRGRKIRAAFQARRLATAARKLLPGRGTR